MMIVNQPLTEILFFIAAFFAPSNADSFTIEADVMGMIEFIRTEDGWTNDSDGSAWRIEGLSIIKESGVEPLGQFLAGIREHDWCERSVLELFDDYAVLKREDGLTVHPDGLVDNGRVIVISYISER